MNELPVVGWREWVWLAGFGAGWTAAKVDTGARSSALHVADLEVDEDEEVVRFLLVDRYGPDGPVDRSVTARLFAWRSVRSSNGQEETRPVVLTTIEVAGVSVRTQLTLTDRTGMQYPMLVGRRTLEDRFLVDVGRSYLGGGRRDRPPARRSNGGR